jgi:hypothetical protein
MDIKQTITLIYALFWLTWFGIAIGTQALINSGTLTDSQKNVLRIVRSFAALLLILAGYFVFTQVL